MLSVCVFSLYVILRMEKILSCSFYNRAIRIYLVLSLQFKMKLTTLLLLC